MSMPFRVGVIGEIFIDRDEETTRVIEAMRSKERLVVYGERRLGKTSILKRAIARTNGELVAVYLDIWGAASEQDVLRSILRQIPPTWLAGDRLGLLVTQLLGMATLGVDPGGNPTFSLNPNFKTDGESNFTHLVGKLNGYAKETGQPIVFVIDEFTKCENRLGFPPPALRALAQTCPALGFIFSGSAVGVISDLLSPSGPFLGIPTLSVQPMEKQFFGGWIRDVLRESDRTLTAEAAELLVDTCYGITSYVLELANACWSGTRAGQTIGPEDVEQAYLSASGAKAAQFELIWDSMLGNERTLLTAITWGETKLTSTAVREHFDLPAASTVTSALKRLREGAYLRPRTPAQIADPFFRAWIRGQNPDPRRQT